MSIVSYRIDASWPGQAALGGRAMAHHHGDDIAWLSARLRVTRATVQRVFDARSVEGAIARSEAFIGSLTLQERAQVADTIRRVWNDSNGVIDPVKRLQDGGGCWEDR